MHAHAGNLTYDVRLLLNKGERLAKKSSSVLLKFPEK